MAYNNRDFVLKNVTATEAWSIISESGDKIRFFNFWNNLKKPQKVDFINTIWSVWEEDGKTVNHDRHENVVLFFEGFTQKQRLDLAHLIDISYFPGSDFYYPNEHLRWIPIDQRLEFLKKHTPVNNGLCYSLFQYYSKNPSLHKGLMCYIGTEDEFLNAKQLADYVQFLIETHGRQEVYVEEAIDHYENWKKNNTK